MFPGACRNTIYKLERGGRVRGPVDPTDGVGAASGDGVQVAGVRWLVAAGLDTSAEGFTFPPCHRIYHTRLFSSMHVKRTCIGCTIDWFPFTCAAVPFTCAAVPFTCAAVPLTCAAVPFTRAPRCPSRGTCTRLYKVHSSQLRNPAQFRTLSVKHRSRLLPLHLP